MEYRTLNDGVRMPTLGLGTWDLRGGDCVRAVATALRMGYELVDTATMYQNEREVGQGVRQSGVPRERVFVTTKVYRPDNSYDGTSASIRRSLCLMGLDYLDLVLIHEPYAEAQAMWRALRQAQEEGLVRSIGVSNFHGDFLRCFLEGCDAMPAVDQVESHVYYPQLGLRDLLESRGVAMQAWAPFTEGRRPIFSDPTLQEVASAHGCTAGQVALRYLLQRGVMVVAKSSREDRLRENLAALDVALTEEDMARIARLDEGRSLFGWY